MALLVLLQRLVKLLSCWRFISLARLTWLALAMWKESWSFASAGFGLRTHSSFFTIACLSSCSVVIAVPVWSWYLHIKRQTK